MTRLRAAPAIALLAALAACSGPAARPAAAPRDAMRVTYRAKFLKNCEATPNGPAQTVYCECVEDALEARLSDKELVSILHVPALKQQFAAITHACAGKAGLTVRT